MGKKHSLLAKFTLHKLIANSKFSEFYEIIVCLQGLIQKTCQQKRPVEIDKINRLFLLTFLSVRFATHWERTQPYKIQHMNELVIQSNQHSSQTNFVELNKKNSFELKSRKQNYSLFQST